MASSDEVAKIASLARLELSPDEMERLRSDVNAILEYVHTLDSVDVSEVQAMSHVHGITNVLRDDYSEDFENKEQILANIPVREDRHIIAPLVVDDENTPRT